jgi:hypothetical protein
MVLGVAIMLPCAYGVYKSGVWTWSTVQLHSGGGHPLNATFAIAFGLLGLLAILATGAGSLGGLALTIASLVAMNQPGSSQNTQPAAAETSTTAGAENKDLSAAEAREAVD